MGHKLYKTLAGVLHLTLSRMLDSMEMGWGRHSSGNYQSARPLLGNRHPNTASHHSDMAAAGRESVGSQGRGALSTRLPSRLPWCA